MTSRRGRGPRLGAGYWRLWTASTISNLGDGVVLAAMPLLAASITRDPSQVALVSLAATLPWLLFALLAGVLADRVDRRRAMAVTDVFRMLVMATLAALVLADEQTIVVLVVAAFLLGSAETVFDNAAQAILPSVVVAPALERANGRLYAAETVTNEFAGPPLGSVLFALAAAAPFFVDAASFGVAALLVATLRGSFRPSPNPSDGSADGARRTVRTDLAEGLRWLWRHRLLRDLAVALGVLNLVATAIFAVLVLYALEVLHVSEAGYGVLLSVGAVGGVLGSLVVPALSRRLGPGTLVITAVFVLAATYLVPVLTTDVVAVAASLAFAAACGIGWNVVTVSLRQALVPDHLLGRVNSAYRFLGWGTMPIGALVGGALADAFGLRAPFVLAAVAVAATGVVLLTRVRNGSIAAARAAAVSR